MATPTSSPQPIASPSAPSPPSPTPRRVAIVDRGQGAMRVIQAVRELRHEGTPDPAPTTIAFHAPVDAHATFVREADEAVEVAGLAPGSVGELAVRLREACSTDVWFGWGPWSLDPEAVRAAEKAGARVMGFSLDALQRVGERGLEGVAASAGMSLGPPDLVGAGDAGEPPSYRLEVTVLIDRSGATWAAPPRHLMRSIGREPSIEESGCAGLDGDDLTRARTAAERVSTAAALRGSATVSLRMHPGGSPLLVAIRPGAGPGHPATESVTGLDLVKAQLRLVEGAALADVLGAENASRGCALTAFLAVAQPTTAFERTPGFVELLRLPSGPGLRVDPVVFEGDVLTPGSDPMLAVVTAAGADRAEAAARLRRGLTDAAIFVRGARSTDASLIEALEHPDTATPATTPQAAPPHRAAARGSSRSDGEPLRYADVALVQAAIDASDADAAEERAAFLASAARGRPAVGAGTDRTVELRYRGRHYEFVVARLGLQDYLLTVDGRRVRARLDRFGRSEGRLHVAGQRHRVVSVAERGRFGDVLLIAVDGFQHRVTRGEGVVVRAPAPAVVISTPVKPGDQVVAGEQVVLLESMKTELSLGTPMMGKVTKVLVSTNVQVDIGAALVQIAPGDDDEAERPEAGPVPLDALASSEPEPRTPVERLGVAYARARSLLLGFDVDPADIAAAAVSWGAVARGVCDAGVTGRAHVRSKEEDLLAIFADTCILSRRQVAATGADVDIARSPQEDLFVYLRTLDPTDPALPPSFVENLSRALAHHGVRSLDRSPALEEALFRVARSHERLAEQVAPVVAILDRRLADAEESPVDGEEASRFRSLLDRTIAATQERIPTVSDMAREVRHRRFDRPMLERARDAVYAQADATLADLAREPDGPNRERRIGTLVECPQPLMTFLTSRFAGAEPALRRAMLEALTRRYYRIRGLEDVRAFETGGRTVVSATYPHEGARIQLFTTFATREEIPAAARTIAGLVERVPRDLDVVVDLYAWADGPADPQRDPDATARGLAEVLDASGSTRPIRRVVVATSGPGRGLGMGGTEHFTFRLGPDGYVEERVSRGLHPMMGKRLDLRRLANFDIERLPSVEDVYLFHAVARENPKDERLVALAEVRDLTAVRDASGAVIGLPHLERMLSEAFAAIRLFQSHRPPGKRLVWNRVLMHVWPPMDLSTAELFGMVNALAPLAEGLGLEKVVLRIRVPNPATGELEDRVLDITNPDGRGLMLTLDAPPDSPVEPLTEYMQKVVVTRQRGLPYPYETVRMLAPPVGSTSDMPVGEFVERDLDGDGRLVPVVRPPGENRANIVAGVIRNMTPAYPEGMTRVILLGDPSRALGSLAEPECRRIIAGIDLAQEMGVPLEWFALSAGAKISMDSGTENMDWVARVLRRLIEFTQGGGEVNIVVAGINVGAQPYWNAEATMLMHTRGILIMTPQSAMVLTGKQALDYSGGVSAEDNFGIGGYERVMGPNGQAQYWAADLHAASRILIRHYELTYVRAGERFPRRVLTGDPTDRDVRTSPHRALAPGDFATVGDVFSSATNPDRKHPFDIRSVMAAVVDADVVPLERWPDMRDAEVAVVWDARIGGISTCLLGIESRPIPRHGPIPADGPDHWTAGTLFPMASKKIARAINAASGNRPVTVLANLSGFDGSPESLGRLQLEYGAEIGRAVTNFQGPIVFVVVSRYHGGAFVVFSAPLNGSMEVAAVEGSFASVIGGAPAAAVVFTRDVDARTDADPRVVALRDELAGASGADKAVARAALDEVRGLVRTERLGEVAAEFDGIHTIYRAQRMGSVHAIIPPEAVRPYVIDALERGIAGEVERWSETER